jgi:amino acid transporter
MIVASYIGYKLVFRTKFRDPKTADLYTGRALLSPEQVTQLERYKALSKAKRFGTYVQLW